MTRLPLGIVVAILLVATYFRGAFQLEYWGAVAVLALAVTAGAVASGGARIPGRGVAIAVACAWGLAGWSLLSATWADSPAAALEGGCRTLLYAALFTLAATTVRGRAAGVIGGALVAGITVIAGITLARVLGGAEDLFLAGRLNAPVEYRNATACLFAFAFWPLVSVAAHRAAHTALRGFSLGGAGLVLGLAFLTQARGMALGLVLGGAVVLALGPDRIRRVWLALIAAGAVAAASPVLLRPYDAFIDGQANPTGDISSASTAVLFVALGLVLAGVLVALIDQTVAADDSKRRGLRTAAVAALVAVAVVVVIGGLVRVGDPVSYASDRVDEFGNLDTTAKGKSRLTFGGGQRADLWDIAWDEFSAHPVGGVGEGNYAARYYRERRTDRNLSTPHSLVMSQLAETGAVGMLLALGVLGGVAFALVAGATGAGVDARRGASALAAAGAVVVGQATVDWLWLIPGVAGFGLLALGLAVARLAPEVEPALASRGRPVVRVAGGIALVACALVTACVYLSDVQVRRASAPSATADERLDRARSAERWNPLSVSADYQRAGALEELGRPSQARNVLRGALDAEPESFVTLALLGDLELRAGRDAAARRYYRAALKLNPRDVGLAKLVQRGS